MIFLLFPVGDNLHHYDKRKYIENILGFNHLNKSTLEHNLFTNPSEISISKDLTYAPS